MDTVIKAALVGEDFDEALEGAETMVRNARKRGDRRAEARGLNMMASVHYHSGEPDQVLSRSKEAGKIFHDLKDYLDEVGTLETCLSVHVEMEKVALAVETTKQMVKVLQDTAHTQQYA